MESSVAENRKEDGAVGSRDVTGGAGRSSGWRRKAVTLLVAMAATAAVFAPAAGYDFTNWDDPVVLLHRTRVRSLAWENLIAIWTSPHSADFFPVTETSYALEFHFAGYNPRVYHTTNIVLHVICTGLVFWLGSTLGLGGLGAMVAALVFGLHPMHVETAAWVADRKDLWACLFSLLSILSFVAHGRRGAKWFYVLGVVLGVGAILSKPSAVSLGACVFVVQTCELKVGVRRALLRSAPLLAVGLAFTGVVIWMHYSIGNIKPLSFVEPERSILLPVYSFAFHVCKFLWPHPLIALYDLGPMTWGRVATWGAIAVTAALFASAWFCRRNKWVVLAVGLYATGIAPALRFASVGQMDVADRYMYFPSVGFCLLLGAGAAWLWACPEKRGGGKVVRWATVGGLAALAGVLGMTSSSQVQVWRNSGTLWTYQLRYNPRAAVGHVNMGAFLSHQGDKTAAIDHFEEALKLNPNNTEAHYNLAEVLIEVGRLDEAIAHCRQALVIEPQHPRALNNWGIALVRQGDVGAGIEKYREALKVKPGYGDAHYNLAIALYRHGKYDDALYHFERYGELMRYVRTGAKAHLGMAMALAGQGKAERAKAHFEAALELEPDNVEIHVGYGSFLYQQKKLDEAEAHARRAIELAPNHPEAHNNLAAALAVQGRYDEAIAHYREAIQIAPRHQRARDGLAWTLAKQRQSRSGRGG